MKGKPRDVIREVRHHRNQELLHLVLGHAKLEIEIDKVRQQRTDATRVGAH